MRASNECFDEDLLKFELLHLSSNSLSNSLTRLKRVASSETSELDTWRIEAQRGLLSVLIDILDYCATLEEYAEGGDGPARFQREDLRLAFDDFASLYCSTVSASNGE